MPSLASLTDAYEPQSTGLPVETPYSFPSVANDTSTPEPTALSRILNRLTGTNGEERYQTWPEKIVRSGVTAAGDALSGQIPQYAIDQQTGDVHTSPQMIERAMDMSAVAGTGGLAGVGEDAGTAIGAGPFLRPALKYNGKIYKAPIKKPDEPLFFGAEHSDALPIHLQDEFYKKAMNGEDINDYQFGFMNHKGQFLDRPSATDYSIKEGLADPRDVAYNGGILTSTMLSDSSKPGAAIEAAAKAEPFYSAVEHQVNNIPQAKMTGEQWLGTLANKPGVKPEELDWTGLKDFLTEKGKEPVTKAEVQDYVNANKVELKEVEKGSGEYHYIQQKPTLENYLRYFEPILDNFKSVEDVALAKQHNPAFKETVKGHSDQEVFDTIQEAKKPIHPMFSESSPRYDTRAEAEQAVKNAGLESHLNVISEPNIGTKYHSYQLPGGENYREMLMTLPPKTEEGLTGWNKITADSQNYKSSHWDEPNILAHVRMNDRTIEGKRSLHLEEIQSDWHQQGRDEGYSLSKEAEVKAKSRIDELLNKKDLSAAEKIEYNDLMNNISKSGVPDAPFKKSWHELALKRMIREAAEKGYDRLSWTPGEAQAARYDLSKSVDKLYYDPGLQGGTLAAEGPNGRTVLDKQGIKPEQIADYVGKEAAKKLLEADRDSNGIHSLEGQQLKIGGEGMKGFYDQIIPKALEKIGKEHGVKVQYNAGKVGRSLDEELKNRGLSQKSFNELSLSQRNKILEKVNAGKPVHYIDIPQSLKDTAMRKGFPLFSGKYMFTPVQGNPFDATQEK